MQKHPKRNYPKKRKRTDSKGSYFEKYPGIRVSRYWIPKKYQDAVHQVIELYRQGISFNRAVDRMAATDKTFDRNKLAEHTLKFIANDY